MKRIHRNKDIVWRSFEDQGVLLDVDSGKILGLNKTAARVWELLESETTIEEITSRISAEFGEPVEDVRRDVEEFVEDLSSRGLVGVSVVG